MKSVRSVKFVNFCPVKKKKYVHIGIPFILFELFFDDALVDMIVGYTKLYRHKEKADTSFEITN